MFRYAKKRRDAYYSRVADLLQEEFRWDDTTRDLCLKHLSVVDGPSSPFEFILDEYAGSATFRLKWGEDGLRVAYYPTIPPGNPARETWCAILTEKIRGLQ